MTVRLRTQPKPSPRIDQAGLVPCLALTIRRTPAVPPWDSGPCQSVPPARASNHNEVAQVVLPWLLPILGPHPRRNYRFPTAGSINQSNELNRKRSINLPHRNRPQSINQSIDQPDRTAPHQFDPGRLPLTHPITGH